jgi:carbon storage regulator
VLVLSRKQNQSLVIGDNIVITILSIDRDQIRLGIEAPRDISIMRQELFQAVKEQELIEKHLAEKTEIVSLENLRKFLADQVPDEDKPE